MVSDKVGYDDGDWIWLFSPKWGKKSTKTLEGSQGVEPQVANRVSNLEKEDTRRVYDPKTFNSGDILLEDKSCVGAWVE